MNRLIITGSSGFLGSHLADHFFRQGWAVTGIDRVALANTTGWEQYSFPLDSADFVSLLRDIQPQTLIHAAGGASVGDSVKFPERDFANGPQLIFSVLNALRESAPSARMLFLSSAAVYGQPESLPIAENSPCKPLSPYGYHKQISESLCREFFELYGIPSASVRIFSAYGEGLQKQVVWDIFQKILKGAEATLQGSGRETRDFIHARDVCAAAEIVLRKGELRGEIYNVASGIETSIADLASEILAVTGAEARLKFDGHVPDGNPVNWRADISQLIKLGFAPQVSLKEGLGGIARSLSRLSNTP